MSTTTDVEVTSTNGICTTPGPHQPHALDPRTVCDGTEYQNTHLGILEHQIRGMAGSVEAAVRNRVAHPAYGYTKTAIRRDLERMEGAIGLYMVITSQANHPGVPALALFRDDRTVASVTAAREAVKGL